MGKIKQQAENDKDACICALHVTSAAFGQMDYS